MIATGEFENISQARKWLASTSHLEHYKPQ